jgi:hypothetical protein
MFKKDKRKKYYLILDSETSMDRHVQDFGAVLCDRQGNIHHSIGVLVAPYWGSEKLFYNRDSGFFGLKNLALREDNYKRMLESGERMLCSVSAVNKWLEKAVHNYDPILTAYNLAFDADVCKNSGIDLSIFKDNFCLWKESSRVFASRKSYINFCIEHKNFSAKFNMQTSAEVMAAYITGEAIAEPHTALEDARDFELPILVKLLQQKKGIKHIAYNWRNYQGKNLLTAA